MNAKILLLSIGFLLVNTLFGQSRDSVQLLEINDLLYVDASQVQNDSLQRLNLVKPEGEEGMPLFIWIGGGAWAM